MHFCVVHYKKYIQSGNMKILQFKTNIGSRGSIAKVRPFLNTKEGIDKWDITLSDDSGLLTVKTNFLAAGEIIAGIRQAGFTVESLD